MLTSKRLIVVAVFLLISSTASAQNQQTTTFTDAQKAAIENIVRELLTKKEPDLVLKAAQEMQDRMEKESINKGQQAISANRERLFSDPNSPIAGNPKGDITLVEFVDYQCGYCKMSFEGVQKLIAEDKNLKVVYKQFPILGNESVQAAKAALASVRQGKFHKFHENLLSSKERLSDEVILKVAKDSGLNTEKLKKDMADPAIEKMIKDNYELAKEIGAQGTPTFVVGDFFRPGAMQYEDLKNAVNDARAGKKK